MRTRRILGTLAVGAAASLLLAPQASASIIPPSGGSWDHTWTTTDSANGGTLNVLEHGDILELCDTAADGTSAHADISYGTATSGVSFEMTASGNGNCVSHDAADGGVYNLPEGIDIYVEIGLGSSSTPPDNWTSVYSTYFKNDH